MHDELPAAIRSHLDRLSTAVGGQWQLASTPKRGFSPAVVYPIQIAGQRYALRNWNWPVSRLDELQAKLQFQQRMVRGWPSRSLLTLEPSSDCPVAVVLDSWASGHLVAQANDLLWTLSSWRSGASIGWKANLSMAQLQSLANTLAKMHGVSLAHGASMQHSGGWQDRLERLRTLSESEMQPARSQVRELAACSDSVIRRLRSGGYFSQGIQWVHTQAIKALPACWIIRDSHQDNWLFEGESVSGVVDFGAARCDWVGWDLVRLLSSAGCERGQRTAFIELYIKDLERHAPQHVAAVSQSIEPLVDDTFWRDLDFLQNLLSAMQWRAWSCEDRQWSTSELDRWHTLLDRLG